MNKRFVIENMRREMKSYEPPLQSNTQQSAYVRSVKTAIPWAILAGVSIYCGRFDSTFRVIGLALFVIGIYLAVRQMSERVRHLICPKCCQTLCNRKPGKRTLRQVLWGGWTCPNCGCDVDRYGNKRKA